MTDLPCTQIPIPDAVEYLLGDQQEYTNWQEYRSRYWRKATLAEARAYYNEPEDVILVTDMMVEREDALEPANKPFQRFSVIPEAWQERAQDRMSRDEYKEHVIL